MPFSSVEIYYHKMKNLWDEYVALEPVMPCRCNGQCDTHKLQEEREQRKRLLQFLMGLNESFSAARDQILMMNPLPSVPQAYSMVKQEERQRLGHNINQSFIATANVKANTYSKGQSSSNTNGSNSDSTVKKQGLKCTYCHK